MPSRRIDSKVRAGFRYCYDACANLGVSRQETAASVTYLAQLLRRAQHVPSELRVLDLCTGTGCIPLLFHHEFYAARDDVQLRLLGMDISEQAIDLAQHNLKRVRQSNGQH